MLYSLVYLICHWIGEVVTTRFTSTSASSNIKSFSWRDPSWYMKSLIVMDLEVYELPLFYYYADNEGADRIHLKRQEWGSCSQILFAFQNNSLLPVPLKLMVLKVLWFPGSIQPSSDTLFFYPKVTFVVVVCTMANLISHQLIWSIHVDLVSLWTMGNDNKRCFLGP